MFAPYRSANRPQTGPSRQRDPRIGFLGRGRADSRRSLNDGHVFDPRELLHYSVQERPLVTAVQLAARQLNVSAAG